MNLLVAKFFRVSELDARVFLDDREIFEWVMVTIDRLSFGAAW